MRIQVIELEGLYPSGRKKVNVSPFLVVQININLSDSLTLIDVPVTIYGPDAATPFIYTQDFFTILDSVTTSLQSLGFLNQAVSDSLTITDAVAGAFAGLNVVVSDSITILDNWNYLFATAADSFSITDGPVGAQIIVLVSQGDVLTPGNSPLPDGFQVTLQDSATLVNIYGPSTLKDTLTFLDSVATNLGIPIVTSDSLSLTDAVQLFGVDLLSVSDSLTLSDAANGSIPQTVKVSDFFTIVDSFLTLSSAAFTPLGDTVSLTDSVGLNLLTQVGSPADSIGLSDATVLILELNLNLSDSLTLTDNDVNDNVNTPTINKVFSDSLALTDMVIVINGQNIYLSDPFALSDGIGITDSVSLAVTTDITNYLRRYLNDVI